MARNWGALSPAYRARLERKGINREQYESGVSLSAARGHAKTPEHPSRAEKHPERYGEYLYARLRQRAYSRVRQLVLEGVASDVISRMDLFTIRDMIMSAPDVTLREMANLPSLAALQEKASYQVPRRLQQRYRDRFRSLPTDEPPMPWFILIEGKWYNPFWYH